MSAAVDAEESVARPTAAASPARRFVALVVAGIAVLQLLWIAVVPPFRGSDEFDHAYRAAGVAAGQWRATEAPENGRGLLVEVPRDLVAAAHEQCAALSYTGPDNCSPAREVGPGMVLVGSGAAQYHPAFYWVLGTVSEPFSGAARLYAMRVTGALLCLFFVGLAAWATAVRPGSRWSRVGLLVAMTPVMLYSTAVAAPNGLEIAAGITLWCSLLSMDASLDPRRERALLVIAGASATLLMVLRMLGPLFALLIVLTVWLLRPSLVRHTVARHPRLFASVSAVVLVGVGMGLHWFLTSGLGETPAELQGGQWRWSSLVLWPLQAIAAFPFRDQPGYLAVYPVVLLIFGALVGAALRLGGSRERTAVTSALVLSLALPLVLTWFTQDGWGTMWQGRYGLPLSVGIVLVATYVLDAHRWWPRIGAGLLVIGSGLMAFVTAGCLVKVLGLELDRAASSADTSWLAPGASVLVLGTLVAWAALWLAVSRHGGVGVPRSPS